MRTGDISWSETGSSLLLLSLGSSLEFRCNYFVCTFSNGSEKLGHLILHSLIQPGFKTNGDYFSLALEVF